MTTPFTPRTGSTALRVLQHMQQHGQPMSRAQLHAAFGVPITNQLDRAVAAGLLRVEGHPARFVPTPALAAAALDGRRPAPIWTDERVHAMLDRYAKSRDSAALAAELGVTHKALLCKAKGLGLKKTEAARRSILQRRELRGSRPYIAISARTERILQLMREGPADGATGKRIAQLIGSTTATLVGNSLRSAIERGIVVRRRVNERHYSYHLNRGRRAAGDQHDRDGLPVQIVVPACVASQRPITTAPASVFDLARTLTTAQPNHHATT